jgi:hypothetical protein
MLWPSSWLPMSKDPEQNTDATRKAQWGGQPLGSSESLILLVLTRAQSAFSVYDPLGHHSQHLLHYRRHPGPCRRPHRRHHNLTSRRPLRLHLRFPGKSIDISSEHPQRTRQQVSAIKDQRSTSSKGVGQSAPVLKRPPHGHEMMRRNRDRRESCRLLHNNGSSVAMTRKDLNVAEAA